MLQLRQFSQCLLAGMVGLSLSACGGGDSDSDADSGNGPSFSTDYQVSGAITGLTASGLKLKLSNGDTGVQLDEITVSSGSTNFTFGQRLTTGTEFHVSLSAQPTGLTCILGNTWGEIAGGNNTQAQVKCAAKTASTLTGTYMLGRTAATFYADGSYVLASHHGAAGHPDNTVEYGIYSWNETTGAFSTVLRMVDTDTNDSGLSGFTGTLTRTNATSLSLLADGETTADTATAVTNTSGSLVGSWAMPDSQDFVVFLSDGTYMLTTTDEFLGATSSSGAGAWNGFEDGQYTVASGSITSDLSAGAAVSSTLFALNANGDAGMDGDTFGFSVSGDTLTVTPSGESAVTLTRITTN